MEIIQDAYKSERLIVSSDKETLEIEFSDKWMNECFEFSCSGFWANLEVALAKVKDQWSSDHMLKTLVFRGKKFDYISKVFESK